MDIFIEKLVAKKKDGKDIAITVAAWVLTILVTLVSIFAIFTFEALREFVFIWIFPAGFIFVGYKLITSRNVEFEYSLTNSELDIDKIIHRRKRKRVVTVNARNIDILALVSSEQFAREANSATISKKFDCSSGTNSSATCFVVFSDKDGQKTLLIFEPNEKMIDGFKRYSTRKVFGV